MKHALYLIGAPGVGKTTVLDLLLERYAAKAVEAEKPFAHVVYPGGVMLGRKRAAFGGTDALAMNVQPAVEEWIKQSQPRRIVAEGDRLANNKFFMFLGRQNYKLTIVSLEASEPTLARRRAGRGSDQNPAWLKGRETKVRNLAVNWATVIIDADRCSPQEIAARLMFLPALNIG